MRGSKILANAIEKCGGGEIILSSDWKNLDKDHDDYKYLVSKLAQCNLKISGILLIALWKEERG